MAASDRPLLIDGFSSVQAVRRAARTRQPAPEPESPSPAEPARAEEAGGRFRHTAVPARYEIVCYGCGFTFNFTGRLRKTYCPKCRITLEADERTVTEPDWAGVLRTIGTVRVEPGASLKGARIVTGDLVLAGRVTGGDVRVCRRLELHNGAAGDIAELNARDIAIAEGASLRLPGTLACHRLEVHGTLRARIEQTDQVVIHAGGCLQGTVHAASLVVHDGGGLKARLKILPRDA